MSVLNTNVVLLNFQKHYQRADPDFRLSHVSPNIGSGKIKGIGNVMRHDYENVTASRVGARLPINSIPSNMLVLQP